jgi:hypothetical protein
MVYSNFLPFGGFQIPKSAEKTNFQRSKFRHIFSTIKKTIILSHLLRPGNLHPKRLLSDPRPKNTNPSTSIFCANEPQRLN